jgi:murein DD-endopeptidase MepM/ murein hydrolase activator NlpD
VDDDGKGEAADAVAAAHFDPRGRWETYSQIPRRPDRLADWGAYRWPVAPRAEGGFVLSGYDLDRPDAEQRRGRGLSHVGHGGVDLAHERGTEVHLVALEHQQGDADVVFVGHLFGTSVVTRHFVREGGRLREYLVMHGHLDGTAPGVVKGQSVREGSLLGWVGDTGSPGIVHLHVEARRVRDGVDVVQLAPTRLMSGETTVVCDPRNVFPLR